MVVIEDFEMPESCLMCRKRKCLHIDGKAYQMCGLNEDGYLRESWFNSENIPIDCRSEYCPLREVEAIPKTEVRKLLRDNAEKVSDSILNIVKEEYIPKSDYENRLKADMVAILKEISTTIEGEREDCEKLSNSYERFGIRAMAQRSQIVIQQKIDNLQVNNSKVRDCATCNYMD